MTKLFASCCVALFACAAEPAEELDVELDDLGVARVVEVGGHLELHDAARTVIGRAELTSASIAIRLHEQAATLAWSDREAWGSCDGTRARLAHRAGSGRELSGWELIDAAEIARCSAPFAVAERLGQALGTALPWRGETVARGEIFFIEQPEITCTTIETWTWGSSCNSCFSEASSQFCQHQSGNCGTPASSRSCSSGAVYTTCSATYCN